MLLTDPIAQDARPLSFTSSFDEGVFVVRRADVRGRRRRVVYLNRYGGPGLFQSWEKSRFGGHHLWGCLELLERGYEVLFPELYRVRGRVAQHFASDMNIGFTLARSLRPDDIVYCAHNVLWWTPLLAKLGSVKARVVGLLYAREPLPIRSGYHGVIAMTKAAMAQAGRLCPRAARACLGWGVDLTPHFDVQPYSPQWGLTCGATLRDFDVIARAFDGSAHGLQMACWGRKLSSMPSSITVMPEVVRPEDLRNHYYANAAYCLITLQEDRGARAAAGFTQLLESMALGRPVIKTRTGALDEDINVEVEGIGLYVPPGDDRALRAAVEQLTADPQLARAMGLRGRALCESYYNMRRFGQELHEFFERL